jgi:predicted deacylase
MIERRHSLLSPTPGTARELISLHYGPAGTGRKVFIQASLHADEVPGLLVAHHLRRRLGELDAQGALRGARPAPNCW